MSVRAAHRPLQGVRVLDFGQLIAVPYATQVLAWFGAEVLLVENPERLTVRILPPFAEGQPGVNRSGGFNLLNSNKQSLTLDLATAEGRELAKDLIVISDVIIENFSLGTMEKMGISYDAARRLRPDIIYLSLTAFGRSGPLKDFAGFHSVINLFSGLASITGYPGGHPRILGGFLPDFLSGCYCVVALLEALHYRRRTGKGQFIELAMTEALTTVLPEAVASYGLSGQEPERMGNHDPMQAPHGIFRSEGDQQWVAFSVASDRQWGAAAQAMGHPEWAFDPRFADTEARLQHQAELDALIQSWTMGRKPAEAAEALQAAGVPATAVFNGANLLADRHLRQRGFVTSELHPETGQRPMGTTAWQIDGSRPQTLGRAPLLGEHTGQVLQNHLGKNPVQTKKLELLGALGKRL